MDASVELSDEPAVGLPTRTPNKRFLQSILKDAHSHNSALAAKEQRRVDTFYSGHSTKDRRSREGKSRRNRHSEPQGEDRGAHHRHHGPEYNNSRRRGRRSADNTPPRSPSPGRSNKSDSKREHARHRRRYREDASPDDERRERNRRRDRKRRTRSRSPVLSKESRYHRSRADSPLMHDEDYPRSRSRHRRRRRDKPGDPSRSPVGKHSSHKSPERRRASDKDAVFSAGLEEPASRRHNTEDRISKSKSKAVEDNESSDPLENIVGPLPPTRYRGRGASSNFTSAMDRHFEPDYNPAEDSGLDVESGDDWAESREALKARQEWKRKGAERLRGVGFSERDIKKWENGKQGDDADRENVVWIKQGESREWDRGKSIGESRMNFVTAIKGSDED